MCRSLYASAGGRTHTGSTASSGGRTAGPPHHGGARGAAGRAVHGLPRHHCARALAHPDGGRRARRRVEPRGIFTTLIPTPVLLQPGPAPGAVPDAAIDIALAAPATARNATAGSRLPMQRWLFDVKTIFGGNGLYQCPARCIAGPPLAPPRGIPLRTCGLAPPRRRSARRAPAPRGHW